DEIAYERRALSSDTDTMVLTGNILVPKIYSEGSSLMRVIRYYSYNIDDRPRCGEIVEADIEDYTVNLSNSGVAVLAPVANFVANSAEINIGESIEFTDQSTNFPTSWSWEFEGGTPAISTDQNPIVTYDIAGVYKVTLTATNEGGSDEEAKIDFITVKDPSLTYCESSGSRVQYEWISGVEVGTFNKTSSAAKYSDFTSEIIPLKVNEATAIILTPGYSGSVTNEYFKVWIDYNQDGDFDTVSELVFDSGSAKKNAQTGTITVPITAKPGETRMRVSMKYNATPDSCGNIGDGEVEDYTVNITGVTGKPVAAFSADVTSVNEGGSVKFTDESTNAPTSWSWSFVGGTPAASTDQNPTVVYNTSGVYEVVLTATNSAGSTIETKTSYITVKTKPLPVVNFSVDSRSIARGESVTFTDESTNNPISWSWEFEGGTPLTSVEQNPRIIYKESGTYQVVLTVTNENGSSKVTRSSYITVTDVPVADFDVSLSLIGEKESVTFTDKSTNNPTSWSWEFEGGSPATSNNKNPLIKYNNAGVYKVILTATNKGGSNSITKTSYIKVEATPVANFTSSSISVGVGESITFTDTSNNEPTSWLWSFTGGSPLGSIDKNPTVTYNKIGVYQVVLTVTNAGGSNTVTKKAYITVTDVPKANFSANTTRIAKGNSVKFTDESTNEPTSWSWEFEGGLPVTSTDQNPSIKYDKAGVYKVVLTATNLRGDDTVTKTKYITVIDTPNADFSVNATTIEKGESVIFTDISSNEPNTWEWTFVGGSPTTSTDQNPTVVYNTEGIYEVILKVTNIAGTNSITKTNYIVVSKVVDEEEINVYPNPADKEITVSFGSFIKDNESNLTLII
ncbi:PKD domain-containing protein, partial [Tenacibaculum sp.]|nr:PKD domain-containing protein [Tenacibaculum sp.]